MINIIIVSDKAAIEIKNAVTWYNEKSPGLSKRFIEELDYSFYRIKQMPSAYKMVDRNIQRCLMKIFPYIIFFSVINGEIVILRIRHKKQKQLKRYK